MENLRLVGKIKDAHGIRGELYVLIFSGDTEWAEGLEVAYLKKDEHSSETKSLTIEKCKVHKDGLILKVKEVSDRNQAEAIKGNLFYISTELLESEAGETIYLAEIENFHVIVNGEDIGEIIDFNNHGAHDILIVQNQTQTIQIPFVDDFIEEIDFEEEKVFMKLPEGLLNINDQD